MENHPRKKDGHNGLAMKPAATNYKSPPEATVPQNIENKKAGALCLGFNIL